MIKTLTLMGAVILMGLPGVTHADSLRPLVGAIRWDAWTGGAITAQVERTLGPQKYHSRLPWFATVQGDGQARIDGGSQAVMDREIAYAANAGLDYWAFLLYPEDNSMSQSLKNYLRSTVRSRIHFCLILHNAFGVPDEQWPTERDRAVALLKEPGYQTVLGGRPLVYALDLKYKGEFPTQRFTEFLRAAHQEGVNPYCVYMGWNPAVDYQTAAPLGFDAVSAYAYGSDFPKYAQLCQLVEDNYWQNAARAKVPYIPLVTTGWDKQPRIDNPVSWEKGQSYLKQKVFPSRATPGGIAAHLARALTFVKEHRTLCAANAVIIYAWNEHDEGGWLEPTWTPGGKPDTGRLDAVRQVLRPGP